MTYHCLRELQKAYGSFIVAQRQGYQRPDFLLRAKVGVKIHLIKKNPTCECREKYATAKVASRRTQASEIHESCGTETASRIQKTCVNGNPGLPPIFFSLGKNLKHCTRTCDL